MYSGRIRVRRNPFVSLFYIFCVTYDCKFTIFQRGHYLFADWDYLMKMNGNPENTEDSNDGHNGLETDVNNPQTQMNGFLPSTPLEEKALESILRLLFHSTQIDFSHYRQTTVLRRIMRRISLNNKTTFAEYLTFIENNPKEAELLYDDLLLSHTDFFRDPEIFEILKNAVFPKLVENRPAKTPIRIWIAGCSSGEEVYSLAICLHEFLVESKSVATVQIFGTDLNLRHITEARRAVYPDKIRKNISEKRLSRYFDPVHEGLQVTKQIREMCVFAVQDVTQDPPFPSIDLVSCRNVLIYFDAALQEIVIPLFHFALKPTGFLLLGTSESMSKFSELFTPVNQNINLFIKRSTRNKILYRFPTGRTASKSRNGLEQVPVLLTNNQPQGCIDMNRQIDAVLLDSFAPPCLVVDNNMQIRQFRGDTARFFSPAPGEASLKLSKMTSAGLMPDIYVAIEEAKKKNCKILKENISYSHKDARASIDIGVIPIHDPSTGMPCFLITFEPTSPSPSSESLLTGITPDVQGEIMRLQNELQATKEHLQSIVEEKDEVNQEMWAANEEIQSTNEELQSVNEEMEAAKEELESSNEELITLNEELCEKNNELKATEEKFRNLVWDMQVGVVLQDPNAELLLCNPKALELLGLTENQLLEKTSYDPDWNIVREDGTLFPGPQHPVPTAIRTGKPVRNVVMGIFRPLTQDRIWVIVDAQPQLNDDGTVRQVVCTFIDISERKKAEFQRETALAQLNERNQFVESLINLSPDIIYIYDIDSSSNIYSNDGVQNILGFSAMELKEMGPDMISRLMHPDDYLIYTNETSKKYAAAKDNDQIITQYRMKHKNGQWRWLFSNELIYLRKADGTPKQIFGIIHDITESIQAKDEILKQKIFFEQMFTQSSVSTQILDKDGWCERINPKLSDIFGVKPENIEGRIYNIFKDEAVKQGGVIPHLEKVFKEGKTAEWEVYFDIGIAADSQNIRVSEKKKVWYYNWAYPILDKDGQLSHVIIQHTNISKRKEAEEALRESEERFAKVFRDAPIWISITDLESGIYVDVNEEALRVSGFTRDEVIGHTAAELQWISNQDREIMIREIKTKGKIDGLEMKFRAKDGKTLHGWFKGEQIVLGGKPCLLTVTIDITERKRIEAEHAKYEQQMQQSQKLESLGVLAGGIAHDFNNLLGGIFGYIDIAMKDCTNDNASACLSKAINTIDRARGLTQQLLTFAKGGAPIKKTGALFPFVKDTAHFALSGSNVSCNFEVRADLWQCSFDKNQIGQVIDNIVINAQQAMPAGGTIVISAKNVTVKEAQHPVLAQGNYVVIAIKDNGIGIPHAIISSIFDPFFTTKTKGHGLGLATCYSIVNRHGGYIAVESEPGKGSTFSVFLPAAADSPDTAIQEHFVTHTGQGTFIVMDDEEVIRETLGSMLESFGYSVIYKVNGHEAIEYFKKAFEAGSKVSGMIFDLTIPGDMGGKEAIKEIRKIDAAVPVFVASGYAEDLAMANPTEFGFTASMCKPFRRIDLAKMLNKWMPDTHQSGHTQNHA